MNSDIKKYKNIEKKIAIEINKNINLIKRGYNIIEYKIKENTEYSESLIHCFNGFHGRIWEIDKVQSLDINSYLNNIIDYGIKYDNITYILDKNKFDKNNICEKTIIINMIT